MWPFLTGLGLVGYGVVVATNAGAKAAAADKHDKKGHH